MVRSRVWLAPNHGVAIASACANARSGPLKSADHPRTASSRSSASVRYGGRQADSSPMPVPEA